MRGWVGVGTGISEKWLDGLTGKGLGEIGLKSIRAVAECIDGRQFHVRSRDLIFGRSSILMLGSIESAILCLENQIY